MSTTASSTSAMSPLVHHPTPVFYVQSPRDSSASASAQDPVEFSGNESSVTRSTPCSSAPSSPFMTQWRRTLQPAPNPKKTRGNYKWATVDEESELLTDDAGGHYGKANSRLFFLCRVYTIALLAILLFAFMALWLVCRPNGSFLNIEGIKFLDFTISHGTDRSQVPTDMLTIKSEVTLDFHNPSKYFRMIFNPTKLDLSCLEMKIAEGKVLPFILGQGSHESIDVKVESQAMPLYGVGVTFESLETEAHFQLTLLIDTKVSILWNLLTRELSHNINCDLFVNTITLEVLHRKCHRV